MRFPIIKIKDLDTKVVRNVGTSTHDYLYINEKGRISYYNLQNSGGLSDCYSFEGEFNEWQQNKEVEMVDVFEILSIFRTQFNRSCTEELNNKWHDAIAVLEDVVNQMKKQKQKQEDEIFKKIFAKEFENFEKQEHAQPNQE